MTAVAARYKVSANYLARVCHHLNVPHPPRGYWAKLHARKEAECPNLPQARPGEVLEWLKGEGVPRMADLLLIAKNKNDNQITNRSAGTQSLHHQLVAGVRDYFEACRFSEIGYFRAEAKKKAEVQRQQWEVERREYERQEKERRMAEALKASRQ